MDVLNTLDFSFFFLPSYVMLFQISTQRIIQHNNQSLRNSLDNPSSGYAAFKELLLFSMV